jgi:hypothetical protein
VIFYHDDGRTISTFNVVLDDTLVVGILPQCQQYFNYYISHYMGQMPVESLLHALVPLFTPV